MMRCSCTQPPHWAPSYDTATILSAVQPATPPETAAAQPTAPLVALDPKQRLPFPLVEREELTHDTVRLRFGLPSPQLRCALC